MHVNQVSPPGQGTNIFRGSRRGESPLKQEYDDQKSNKDEGSKVGVGIAIDEGFIDSLDQPVTAYIPELLK